MASRTIKIRLRAYVVVEFLEPPQEETHEQVSIQKSPEPESSEDGWPKDTVEFGRAVRRARELHGLTRKVFAKQVGVADSTIRNIEYGWHTCQPAIRRYIIQAFAQLDPSRSRGCEPK